MKWNLRNKKLWNVLSESGKNGFFEGFILAIG